MKTFTKILASAAVIAPPPPEPRDEDVAMGELAAVKQAPTAPVRPAAAVVEEKIDEISTDQLLKEAEVLAAAARAAAQGDAKVDQALPKVEISEPTQEEQQAAAEISAEAEKLAAEAA